MNNNEYVLKNKLLQTLQHELNFLRSTPTISLATQEKLIEYILLLNQWNQIHNLSGIKDPVLMVNRHLIDSLTLVPILEEWSVKMKFVMKTGMEMKMGMHQNSNLKIIDIGTGAGLPGIPLSITFPELQFTLLDSNQKKMTFIQQVVLSLGLTNVEPICQRAELYHPKERFDCAISRAFGSLSEFILATKNLIKPDGLLLAMKGQQNLSLFKDLPPGYTIQEIRDVSLNEEAHDKLGERCVVFIKKNEGNL